MQNSAPINGSRRPLALTCLGAVLAFAATGCAIAPWDRDLMAKKAMQFDVHPNLTAFNDHIYFSKEGSSGGRTSDGGGCGCN